MTWWLSFLVLAAIGSWTSVAAEAVIPSCQINLPDVNCVYIDNCGAYVLAEALRNASASGSQFKVHLERSVLADLPASIFEGHRIKELHVRYSILPLFPPASFNGLDSQLVKLDLSYNGVATLDLNAMKNLPFRTSLGYLSLYQNALETLAPFSFVDFPFLYFLDLSRNLLQALPDYAFGGLTSLNELQLSGNQIASIGQLAFTRMDKLSTLNLGDNWLSALANNTFNDQDMPIIANVWLPYNIFTCDCKLQWLKDWLTNHDILEDSRGTCESPRFATFSDVTFCTSLKGQRLLVSSVVHHHNGLERVKEVPT